ncbi:hypothetical protein ABZ697_29540 [Streptomyces albidoflavus]|uniref:hypothetical protein n=1 Tax=Streptomyces albidoflavus TaxID=1886 RepID=UPI0033F97804
MNLRKRTPRQATVEARPVRRAGLALAAASLLVVGGTACESDGATPGLDASGVHIVLSNGGVISSHK